MTPTGIFISYRRDDSAGYARAIGDALGAVFGAGRVFIDVDDIGAGQPFDEVITQAVGGSAVLLVLIGPRWLGPRLQAPDDFVHREVAAGLAGGLLVIPLLLDGATMPTEAQLPAPLRPLARRNALEIGQSRFAGDLARLVDALRGALGDGVPPAEAGPRRAWRAVPLRAGAVMAVMALLVLLVLLVVTASSRPAVNGDWWAAVSYDWPNAHYRETFSLAGDGTGLHGSASFLGLRRGMLEGQVGPDGVQFITRSSETLGATTTDTVHRYRGRLVADELHLVMQTEGGNSAHVPVQIVARRGLAPAASAPPVSGR